MKAAPVNLDQFYNRDDINFPKVSIKNFTLDDNTTKALILILPYMHNFNELELYNNHLTDAVAPALLLSFFANPRMKKLTVAYNYMRTSFVRTLAELVLR